MSLSITYDDLRREISRLLGWTETAGSLNASQIIRIDDILKQGLRRAYIPPQTQLHPRQHEWSWLSPVATLTMVSGTDTYTLPSDYAGIVSRQFTYTTANTSYSPIELVSSEMIRRQMQVAEQSNWPMYAAVEPIVAAGTAEQRWQVLFYPNPNAAYVVSYRYRVNPFSIDATNVYPYGGQMASNMLLEACLSVTEEKMNDMQGFHFANFMRELDAAIDFDIRLNQPKYLGVEDGHFAEMCAGVPRENLLYDFTTNFIP